MRLARIFLLTGRLDDAGALADVAARAARRQRRAAWSARAQLIGVEARQQAGAAGEEELAVARRAAGRLERSGDLHGAVEAYLVAGRVALDLGRPRAAAPALARARALAGRGQVLVRLRGRLAGALAERAAGHPAGVLAECRAGLRDLAVHRSVMPTIELRALASGHGAELGEIGLGVVLAGSSPARALAWMERTRAAALQRAAARLRGAVRGCPPARRRGRGTCRARLGARSGRPGPARPGARLDAAPRRRRAAGVAASGPRDGGDARRARRPDPGRVRRAPGPAGRGRRRAGTLAAGGARRGRGGPGGAATAAVRPAPAGQPPRRRCRGGRPRERGPADRPAARPAHGPSGGRRPGGAGRRPGGAAPRRPVVLPARRAARPGAVGDVLGPCAAGGAGTGGVGRG